MRGQIWTEMLIIVGGIVVGSLVALSVSYPALKEGARSSDLLVALSIVETNLEHLSMIPYSIQSVEDANGIYRISAYPDTNGVVASLRSMGFEVEG